MKIVLDTNVLISAIFWSGAPNNILRLIEDKSLDLELAVSPEILRELLSVLQRGKFQPYLRQLKLSPEELVSQISGLAKVYSPDKELSIIKTDPSDNKFLSCALTAEADFIISGDKHLLKLKSFHGIAIITPRQFLNRK